MQPKNPPGKQGTWQYFFSFKNKYFITNESDNALSLNKIP